MDFDRILAWFWTLLGVLFILGLVLPSFEIGLPYTDYIFPTVIVIALLVMGLISLKKLIIKIKKKPDLSMENIKQVFLRLLF